MPSPLLAGIALLNMSALVAVAYTLATLSQRCL